VWSLVRSSYWAGDLTRHQALESLWFGYGPPAVRRGLREIAEFTSYRSMVHFLDGYPPRPRPNLPN
jgi:hypothetical protein